MNSASYMPPLPASSFPLDEMGPVITCCVYVADQFIAAHSDSFDGFWYVVVTSAGSQAPHDEKHHLRLAPVTATRTVSPLADKDAKSRA